MKKLKDTNRCSMLDYNEKTNKWIRCRNKRTGSTGLIPYCQKHYARTWDD